MGDKRGEQTDRPTSGRPTFSRTAAPVGVYNGEQAIIVYDLRPLPPWPKYWINALTHHFHCQLHPAPNVDISVVDDCLRFAVFVSNEVSVDDLCRLDDAVCNALKDAGDAFDRAQTDLNQKLDQVRKRRLERTENTENQV